jgi:hypothetical protein
MFTLLRLLQTVGPFAYSYVSFTQFAHEEGQMGNKYNHGGA